jgi:hypothetical protein
MMNISWGTKIAILYSSFVLMIGVMVYVCVNQQVDLVSDDYYERELAFQDKINEMNNANALPEKIIHTILASEIQLQFPNLFKGQKMEGEIYFFRPSDKSKDFKLPVSLNDNMQEVISLSNLSKGMYKMQINWTTNEKKYFSEEVIVIP